LEHLAAQTNGPPLLRDDAVVLRMIDGGYLPADGVAADVDNRKMVRHRSTFNITEREEVNEASLQND